MTPLCPLPLERLRADDAPDQVPHPDDTRLATPADTLRVEVEIERRVGLRAFDPQRLRAGEVCQQRPGVAVERDGPVERLVEPGRRRVVFGEVRDRNRVVRGVVGVELGATPRTPSGSGNPYRRPESSPSESPRRSSSVTASRATESVESRAPDDRT